jgi:hypothetical protein
MEQISSAWLAPVHVSNSAHVISAKFKLLRRILKLWSKNLYNLAKFIANCNMTIAFFDKLEEIRGLFSQEVKFRVIVKDHVKNLLAMQREYWRQRFTQRVIHLGMKTQKKFM